MLKKNQLIFNLSLNAWNISPLIEQIELFSLGKFSELFYSILITDAAAEIWPYIWIAA